MSESTRLRIGVQKSGNLTSGSFSLLRRCGFTILKSSNHLLCRLSCMPIDILPIRDDDILTLIKEDICDLGIIGYNLFKESLSSDPNLNVKTKIDLGFSKCRLSIAIPKDMQIKSLTKLSNLKIATSYPAILREFLDEHKIKMEIIKMEGSVELAVQLKIADVICDLVSTGATLEANNLIEFLPIMKSQAVLVAKRDKIFDHKKSEIITNLMKRIQGVIAARENKYVVLNAPKDKIDQIVKLLPGADSPTIIPLLDKTKVAIHAVCSEEIFWETMENLKLAGANAILVMGIEKMLIHN